MTSPDGFEAPHQSTTAGSERPTAPGVGGIRTIGDKEYAAILGGRHHGKSAVVDHQASAALERQIENARPRQLRQEKSGITVSNTTLILNMGGPKPGFKWTIRRINVGPVDYSAGNYPTVSFVIATIGPQSTGQGPVDSAAQVVSQTTAYPAEGTWGRDELEMNAGEYLRILVGGLSAGVTVTASAVGQEQGAVATEQYAI